MSHRRNQGSSRGGSSRHSCAAPDIGTSHVPLQSTSCHSPQAESWGSTVLTWDSPSSPTWGNNSNWGNGSEVDGWPSVAAIASLDWDGENDWDVGGRRAGFYFCICTYIASTTEQFHPPSIEPDSRQRSMESMRRYFNRLSTDRSRLIASENTIQQHSCLSREAAMAHVQNPVAGVQLFLDGWIVMVFV